MPPRPAPDLDLRREQILTAARTLAETEGWAAVTMRRLAAQVGATQPVLYTAFHSRQALLDAVAVAGFAELADALEATELSAPARMRAFLDYAAANPCVYEAMSLLPSELAFAVVGTPKGSEPLRRAFEGVRQAFPDADGTRAEVAWSLLHGLATLRASGRLPPQREQARFDLAQHVLTHMTPGPHPGPAPEPDPSSDLPPDEQESR